MSKKRQIVDHHKTVAKLLEVGDESLKIQIGLHQFEFTKIGAPGEYEDTKKKLDVALSAKKTLFDTVSVNLPRLTVRVPIKVIQRRLAKLTGKITPEAVAKITYSEALKRIDPTKLAKEIAVTDKVGSLLEAASDAVSKRSTLCE